MQCPCKDCKPPKRGVSCHSTCEEYKTWQVEHEKEKKIERKKKTEAYYGDSWKVNAFIAKGKRRN